jgi:hypothetical protein
MLQSLVWMDEHDEELLRLVPDDADVVDEGAARHRNSPLHRAGGDAVDHAVDPGDRAASYVCYNLSLVGFKY